MNPTPRQKQILDFVTRSIDRRGFAPSIQEICDHFDLASTATVHKHLKNLADRPWYAAALVSWGIALFEYLLQVPANRIGAQQFSVGQLKIIQEVITLSVFVPFAVYYLREPLKLDDLWAGLCMVGAVYFMFRGT